MRFKGKNVLITGASRGIGKGIALYLARYKLKIWINYKNSFKDAQLVQNEIKSMGSEANIIQFDASNEIEFINAISEICLKDGTLSYLVNNAGITKDSLSLMMDITNYDKVMEVNTKSAFIGSKEALKVMAKNKFGAVVNISSIAGEIGNIGQVNYSASKGAIIAMTKSFAKESASRNIRFNTVTPGFIETDMTEELTQIVKEEYKSKIPLKRFGTTSDVAGAVAFLLSDSSMYITGSNIQINGGLHM